MNIEKLTTRPSPPPPLLSSLYSPRPPAGLSRLAEGEGRLLRSTEDGGHNSDQTGGLDGYEGDEATRNVNPGNCAPGWGESGNGSEGAYTNSAQGVWAKTSKEYKARSVQELARTANGSTAVGASDQTI